MGQKKLVYSDVTTSTYTDQKILLSQFLFNARLFIGNQVHVYREK